MANSQYNKYIGARYVPLFDGEWNNQKSYEPLVIVSYQGASYTSKTYVPMGVDINNLTYWVCTGNYNSQVEAYRQEVQQLKNQKVSYDDIINNVVDGGIKKVLSAEQGKVLNVKIDNINVTSPLDYGAKGDGLNDDTQSLQNAINDLILTGGILDGHGKTYIVSDVMGTIPSSVGSTREDYGLYINGNIIIQNMNLKMKIGCKPFTTPFNIYSESGLIIFKNIKIDGQKAFQSPVTHPSREDGGRHGFRIYGKNGTTGTILMENCIAYNCYSDGMLVRDITQNLLYCFNCSFNANGRNGVTDNSIGMSKYVQCNFTNSLGVSPESGFHIEPDIALTNGNFMFEECIFKGNNQKDFAIHLIKDCVLSNLMIEKSTIGRDISFTCYEGTLDSYIKDTNIIRNLLISVNPTDNPTTYTKNGSFNVKIDNTSVFSLTCKNYSLQDSTFKIQNSNIQDVSWFEGGYGNIEYYHTRYNAIHGNNLVRCNVYKNINCECISTLSYRCTNLTPTQQGLKAIIKNIETSGKAPNIVLSNFKTVITNNLFFNNRPTSVTFMNIQNADLWSRSSCVFYDRTETGTVPSGQQFSSANIKVSKVNNDVIVTVAEIQ